MLSRATIALLAIVLAVLEPGGLAGGRDGSGVRELVERRIATRESDHVVRHAVAGSDSVSATASSIRKAGGDAADSTERSEEFEVRPVAPTGETALHPERDHTRMRIVEDDRGGCVASETVLCLLGNRFRIEASFTAADGATGAAHSTVVSDSTGLLWFFDESDVEILIKMLDACSVRGLPAFWVFTTSTTDLAVTLSITDTLSGAVQDYASPPGEVGPIAIDVTTFDDCS